MEGYVIRGLERILQGSIYEVPDYQRNYAWEKAQLKDLWEDLENLVTGKTTDHYIGTIIVKQKDNCTKLGKTYKVFELIDGQQRLTSLTILLYCICERLTSLGNDEARRTAQNIMSECIYDNGTDTYKLKLNGDDDSFFRDVILRPSSKETAGKQPKTASERRLIDAKRFFNGKLPLSYEELQKIIGKLQNNLIAIRYEVGTEGEAGLIFEVMNDRGKPLSQLDKVKNYLIYLSYKNSRNDLAQSINKSWGEILRNVASIDKFDEDSLLRYHWIMYKEGSKYTRKEGSNPSYVYRRLKATLKPGIPNIVSGINEYFNNSLKEASYVFKELYKPEVEDAFSDWRESERSAIREHLAGLHRLGVMATFMPLLIACRIVCKDAPHLFSDVVRACEVFAFRVNKVAGKRADTRQSTFYGRSHDLFGLRGSSLSKLESRCKEVVKEIADDTRLYCPDSTLEDVLRKQEILRLMKSDGVHYLLYELEKHKWREARETPRPWNDLKNDLKKAQIEHIWPKNPRGYDGWSKEKREEHGRYVGLIGNLTLTFWNSELSNKDFSEKRHKYEESSLHIQRELAKWERWTPNEIEKRTEEIIKFAKRRWAI